MSDDTNRAHYPQSWEEFIGQKDAVRELKISCAAARSRRARLDHILIVSRFAGVGKTSLARLVAMTLGTRIHIVNEQVKSRSIPFLMDELQDGDILFFDELHKQFEGGKRHAEWLLTLLKDGQIPTEIGLQDAPAITVIGATTDVGVLGAPFLTSFPIQPQLAPYTDAEATLIVCQLAQKILEIDGLTAPTDEVCVAIARAASNNPREAGRVLGRLRDLVWAGEVEENDGAYDITEALQFAGLTADGLSARDVAYLQLLWRARGRPLGRLTLREQLGEVGNGLPYIEERLTAKGLILCTDSGRILTTEGRRRGQELAA